MMKHSIIFIVTILICFRSLSQTFNINQPTDTIKLKQINFKKVLAYQIGNATILVEFEDFMKSFGPFWKKYKKGVRSLDRGKQKATEENPWYVKRFIFLDTTYKRLTTQINTQDTVLINDALFMQADIGTSYDFVKKIEEGDCIILDTNGTMQLFILRQKYSYQRGPLDGWGGRLYFIMGQLKPFIRGRDWIS